MFKETEKLIQDKSKEEEKSQEKGPEQNLSLTELKDKRKEALGDGINKVVGRVHNLGVKLVGILKRVDYVLIIPEAAVGAAKFAHEKTVAVDEKIDAGMDKAAEWTSDVADKMGEGVKAGGRFAADKVKEGVIGGGKILKGGVELGIGAVASGADAVDTAMDEAAYWTSAKADRAGEFVSEKYADMKEGVAEKIAGLQEHGREAVEKFSEKHKKAKERNQFLKEKFGKAEGEIKDEKRQTKSEIKASRERDKIIKEYDAKMEKRMARDEKNRARWQELQAKYGLSKEIQKLGVGSQEIMDKAA